VHFPRPSSSAYLLFAGCVAAGSPALGEEGFAPAGFIFAAGVLAFAAAVPAVAFSPLRRPAPPPPAPPAASMMRLGLPPGRALRQKSTSCSAYASFSLCRAQARRQGLNARGVAINFSDVTNPREINVGEAGSADRRKPTA
jgi:hypothetical protein